MKNILISGGSKGIGLEIVKKLYKNIDNKITILSRTMENIDTFDGKRVKHIPIDLSNLKNYNQLDNLTDSYFDLLINCVGGGAHSKIQKISLKKMEEAINLNLSSTIYLTHIVSKNMIKNRKGTIINIGSIHALSGDPNSSLYSASKSALIGFSDSLFKELKPKNIKVTLIHPDLTDTNLLPRGIKGRDKMLKPEEIADIVLLITNLPNSVLIKDLTVYSNR